MDFTGYLLQTLSISLIMTIVSGILPEVGRQRIKEQHNGDNNAADQFEKQLLSMFGLTKRPQPNDKKVIPRIMSHLYRAHMGDAEDGPHSLEDTWEVGFDLPHDDVLKTVNTARGFHHIESEESLDDLPENHIRLKFDLSTLPKNEKLGAAELLLHRRQIQQHFSTDNEHMHRINVYEIIKIQDQPPIVIEEQDGGSIMDIVRRRRNKFRDSRRKKQPIKRLLDTRLIDARNTTWERFDVGVATAKWMKEDNHGLVVEVARADGKDDVHEDVKKHVRLRRDLHEDEISSNEWEHQRPVLMTYLNDDKGDRSVTNLSRRRKKRSGGKRNRKRRQRKNCQKKDLYVDFSEVNWDEWIVAPHGYQAHYCHGECPFPLAEYLNATNHAIVQTLVNSVDASAVPKPCCVPTNLTPISMLYLDEYDLVVLKTYQEMVVDTCGCR